MNSLSSQLDQFSTVFYTDDYKEILEQYLNIKYSLTKRPELMPIADSHKEFSLFDEESSIIQTQTQFLLSTHWKNVVNTGGVVIQTSKTPHQFLTRLRFSIEANPIHVFSVLYENDFAGDWMKTMKCSKTLEKFSPLRKKIQNFYKLPWPLTHRHSILHTRYLPMPELRTILVVVYTPKEHFASPVNDEKHIEMVIPSASVWLQCEDEKCELNIILQANKYIVWDI